MTHDGPPAILGLLSDSVRWQLIVELGRSDRRVGELVDLVGKPQNLVSYHLSECRRAGIVRARRSSADGRDVYYRADLARCQELLAEVGESMHPGSSVSSVDANSAKAGSARQRLLFICTGNSARSQIAEALVHHRSATGVDARSAGIQPKPLHPYAVQAMAERGIDISGHSSKSVSRFRQTRFDRVITLCDRAREVCPTFPGSPLFAHWSMADPAAAVEGTDTYAAFRTIADEIDERVSLLLAELPAGAPAQEMHPPRTNGKRNNDVNS